uniref:Uncharacterized protein n=1 Tax=Xenopus tropicalis TaxID=8364 RepID=A0A6I8R563_XENTR
MHLCDGGETAASNGAGKPETVGSAGPNQTQIIRALRDINILEEKRNILEGSIDNMVAGLGALRGAQRAKAIQKIAYLNKDLEDIETAGSTDMAAGSTNMAAGSTDMAAPLTDKTVCDAAARVGESGATEGAGNPPVNTESEGAQGRRGAWDGKRLFQQNVSMAGESAASRRKNVVKIKWEKERGEFPGRRFVGRNLIKQSLGFTPADVSGLISVTDTEFDLGFKLSQGLDDFWRRYEGKKGAPEWEGFRVTPVSRPDTKTVTIMFKTESVHPDDVLIWLKRQCTVLSPFTPLYDEEGFWVGGWKVQVKLHMNLHVPKHLPNSFFIGKDRGVCFYPGQPRVCFKCGSNRHFTGHPSKECQKIRCNLCLKLGHAHSSCPDAWHNMVTGLADSVNMRVHL